MPTTAVPTLSTYLPPLTVGDPDLSGALAVFPLFGPPPRLDYVGFGQAVARGARLHELAGGASVNDLTVVNPLDVGVLLLGGEEVLGAQQNRTFDVSVLVPAHAKLDVPVSCVEQGRWDGSRHDEAFAPAPQTAFPELRRATARAIREAAGAGLDARADQGEVWDAVAAKHDRMGTVSATGAMHDLVEEYRVEVGGLGEGIGGHDGQVGMLAAIGGRFAVLDHASRPEVFAALREPLVAGYAIDALEPRRRDDVAAPSRADAEAFVGRVWARRLFERDGIGEGRDGRFAGDGLAGAALLAGDELVQLTAFAEDDPGTHGGETPRAARIRRPSRRRGA